MKNPIYAIAISLVLSFNLFGGLAKADDDDDRHSYSHGQYRHGFDYAKVIRVKAIYRRIKVSNPRQECWDEPIYHTEYGQPKSADGMIAGGLIGGLIGHQIGKGRGKKLATVVGSLIGAQVGHISVNASAKHSSDERTIVDYHRQCQTQNHASYEDVVEAYDVTYKFKGKRYHIEMPYHPGKRIKMRIQFTPVI